MYIYRTLLWTDTTDVVGVPGSNGSDVANFEGETKKPNANAITQFIVGETASLATISYADFDEKVSAWSDVDYIDNGESYEILLTSDTPL